MFCGGRYSVSLIYSYGELDQTFSYKSTLTKQYMLIVYEI